MIPQVGFAEMLVLALLAIIVVGPKDLPKMMRAFGGFMSHLRSMAQEFKTAFEEMGAAQEMAELRKEIEELKQMGQLSNLSDAAFEEDMRALDQDLRTGTELDNPKAQNNTKIQPPKPPSPVSDPSVSDPSKTVNMEAERTDKRAETSSDMDAQPDKQANNGQANG